MSVLTKDILYTKEAEHFPCRVYSYTTSHHQLFVSVSPSPGNHFYLLFPSARYFSGQLDWIGANIKIESQSNFAEFLSHLKSTERFSRIDNLQLYTIVNPSTDVKIVSRPFSISPNRPSWTELLQESAQQSSK